MDFFMNFDAFWMKILVPDYPSSDSEKVTIFQLQLSNSEKVTKKNWLGIIIPKKKPLVLFDRY